LKCQHISPDWKQLTTSHSTTPSSLRTLKSHRHFTHLHGSPDYYKINSNVPFKFYLGLLVPQSPGIHGDFVSAQVLDANGNILLTLNGTNSTWTPYFEEFGGDYYLKGPEVSEQLPEGITT